MEEVADMELYTMTRPSMPLAAACAPSALLWAPAAAPVVVPTAERAPITAAAAAPVSRVHQVQVQAELAQALTLLDGINGTTGNTGFKGIDSSAKRYDDGGSGVPPRGRPV
jgi:hypothetical protein